MKNYGDLGGCYPPSPTASTDNTLLDLHNSSQDTQPHSLIVKYSRFIWLNRSITLIRAKTDRYDIVRFSKVTTKSLASGIGS